MLGHRHLYIILVLIALLTIGTFGYSYLENWNIHDSLYMTVITLTTTGFGEVHKLSYAGRNLTMFLLIVGMGTVAYSISVIMSDLLSINFLDRRNKKMNKAISNMKDHIIICGFGRMGKIVSEEISKTNNNFVIIEKDPSKLKILESSGYKFIEGDSTHDEILLKSNVQTASTLVSLIDNDADALYLALAARSFNANLNIIVRASEEEAKSKILRAGANKVILPIVMSGMKLAHSILNSSVEDYINISDVNENSSGHFYQLSDLKIKKNSKGFKKTIKDCNLEKFNLIVVGVKRNNQEFVFSPSLDYKLDEEDIILVLGTEKSYLEASSFLK